MYVETIICELKKMYIYMRTKTQLLIYKSFWPP